MMYKNPIKSGDELGLCCPQRSSDRSGINSVSQTVPSFLFAFGHRRINTLRTHLLFVCRSYVSEWHGTGVRGQLLQERTRQETSQRLKNDLVEEENFWYMDWTNFIRLRLSFTSSMRWSYSFLRGAKCKSLAMPPWPVLGQTPKRRCKFSVAFLLWWLWWPCHLAIVGASCKAPPPRLVTDGRS